MIMGGKTLVSSKPSFSNDAKKLLICTGNTVSVFSTSTSLQITELEGHKALVTSVIVVPASTPASKILCYCWTSSLDGTIRYWDFSIPECIKTINIGFPIFSMVIPSLLTNSEEIDGHMFAYLSVGDINEDNDTGKVSCTHVRKCNLTSSRLAAGVTLAEISHPEYLMSSPSGKFIGILNKYKFNIWKVPAKDNAHTPLKRIVLHHTKRLSILAFHPTERIVAAGDVSGRILIWRGFGNKTFSKPAGTNGSLIDDGEERPGVRGDDDADSCTTLHWHPAEVKVLFFSSDGAYMYSGGNEGVLVVWQLDTGKKKFLPRIGTPLLFYTDSPDPSLSSISCADNRVHILKMPSMEIMKSISGIKPPHSSPERDGHLNTGPVFNHSAGVVALRTDNYCIQFYSLYDDREISEVQVFGRNYQPGDDVTAGVTLVSLSPDGSLMGTAEVKLSEEDVGGLVCLKFWASGTERKDFTLSTIIYEPHGDASISTIAFHPTRFMAVSSSYGGDFKIWVRSLEIKQKDQSTSWSCHAVGSYKKKPMTAATFSADGSVLAIAAETVITLWDPENNVLVAVIGETFEPITTLSFIKNSDYIVSLSRAARPQLSVWSMSMLSACWSHKLQTEAVACMAETSSFAVLALLPRRTQGKVNLVNSGEISVQGTDGAILLFDVENPVPVATWFVKKAKGGGLGFIQQNQSSIEEYTSDEKPSSVLLAYLNGDREYLLFDPKNKDTQLCTTSKPRLVGSEESEQIGYASIYGELPEFSINKTQTPSTDFISSDVSWDTIFRGSSHTLPPLTKLCSSFLESLLEKRSIVLA